MREMQGERLFCVQSAPNHWKNLSDAIDRCCVFVDHLHREVYVCWYGHAKTRKLAGVVVPVGKKDIEKVAMACVGEFGFHSCPIFRVDFVGRIEKEGKKEDSFFPLQCYTRPFGSKSVLCPSKKPTKNYNGEKDPSFVLFPSANIHWMWKKSGTRIGAGKAPTDVYKIETNREISNIGWKNRERAYDLLELERKERKWQEENTTRTDALVAERRREIQRIAEIAEERRENIARLGRCSEQILSVLGCKAEKVHEMEYLPK